MAGPTEKKKSGPPVVKATAGASAPVQPPIPPKQVAPNPPQSGPKKQANSQPKPPPNPQNPPKKGKQATQSQSAALSAATQSTIDVLRATTTVLTEVTVAKNAAEERATSFENQTQKHKATIAQLQKQLSNLANRSVDTPDTKAKLDAATKEINGLKSNLQTEQSKLARSAESITRMQHRHTTELAELQQKLDEAVASEESSAGKVLVLETKLAKIKTRLEKKKEKMQELENRLDQVKVEPELDREFDIWQEDARKSHEEREQRITVLEAELQQKNETILALTTERESHEKGVDDAIGMMKRELTDLQDQLVKVQKGSAPSNAAPLPEHVLARLRASQTFVESVEAFRRACTATPVPSDRIAAEQPPPANFQQGQASSSGTSRPPPITDEPSENSHRTSRSRSRRPSEILAEPMLPDDSTFRVRSTPTALRSRSRSTKTLEQRLQFEERPGDDDHRQNYPPVYLPALRITPVLPSRPTQPPTPREQDSKRRRSDAEDYDERHRQTAYRRAPTREQDSGWGGRRQSRPR